MYKNFFSINKNFQSSINLELDLNNEEKIKEYIPTSDICDVLKRYLRSIIGETNERATTLVGPYGKGKSFLLLVLTYILRKKKSKTVWNDLCKKIKKVDIELYETLEKIENEKIYFLPIIINSNYDNVVQSFQLALNEALKREKINNLMPQTVYTVCLDLIQKWEKDKKTRETILNFCLTTNKISLENLKNELVKCSPKAYEQFTTLYNCVNIGLDFNPLVNNDVVKLYGDITEQLCNKYGYSGMFIVFDEFSKFLESSESTLMKDLKIIQDFAELCARSSKKKQLNLCCVTHKSLSLYVTENKQVDRLDSFKTVEGRFVEIKFNRSLDENYQIIDYAIQKKNGSQKIIDDFVSKNADFYKRISNLNIFLANNVEKTLYKGCFPLNPLTVYILIQLSEIVAQNERTLFTFLADSDENSFNSFISNNNFGLFNVDKIYDYFSNILKKEKQNSIRNIWYRSESVLSKIDILEQKKVIKALAIIKMIADEEKLAANEEVISCALELPIEKVTSIVNELIDKHYLRRNILNNLISFAFLNSKHIDDKIDYLTKTKFKNINYSDYLNLINTKRFIIPRRYNEQNKITRYFSVAFLNEEAFKDITDFTVIFDGEKKDGIVINLLVKKMSKKQIEEKVNSINDPKIVIKYPKDKLTQNFYDLITRYACLSEILIQDDIDEIARQELVMFLDETEADLKQFIENYYENNFNFVTAIEKDVNFNSTLSKIMDEIYNVKLIFNNELINKKNVSAQYQKAINNVINYLLDANEKKEFNYSETSPETSIKTSIIDANQDDQNFRNIINEIKAKIIESNGQKLTILDIIQVYSNEPYGIRNGVLPIILAKAISEVSDNIVLYYQNKEIDLNAINIVKAVANEKYYIKFSKKSVEQVKYLEKMMKLFEVSAVNNFRENISILSEKIRKYFLNLPNIIRTCSQSNNFLNASENYINYKNVFLTFNINHFESIFDEPIKIFKEKSLKCVFENIKSVLNESKPILDNYKTLLISQIKNAFEVDINTSLKMGLNDWLRKNVKTDKNPILEEREKNIFNCIKDDLTFDDYSSLNSLTKTITGDFIEDSNKDITKSLNDSIVEFKNNIRNAKYYDIQNISKANESKSELSAMGGLMKNSLESIVDEYSDSVSSEEKIEILKDIINKILK